MRDGEQILSLLDVMPADYEQLPSVPSHSEYMKMTRPMDRARSVREWDEEHFRRAGWPENLPELTDLNTWLAERGFRVLENAIDYSEAVRSSPWGKRSPSRDHHVWVDLAKPDSTVVSAGYGSGLTLADAAMSARRRWQQEQEGGTEPGPRTLP